MSNGIPGTPQSTVSRQGLYAMASKHAARAIEVLRELMESDENGSVRMGAAKVLLAKALPDLKAMEISGKDGEPLKVLFVPAEVMAKYQIENKQDAIEAEITNTTTDALPSNTSTSS